MLRTLIRDPDGPEIIICCGSGGVGKTTVSAAIGLLGAMNGRKTVVLTVDPARRLADALGLKNFRQDIQQVPLEEIFGLAKTEETGLFAMMLDPKRTFDELIFRYAPTEIGKRIVNNHYYQHLSNHMAGSYEYMAMENLYEVHRQGRFDLIVLDTPPSRRALDFLDSPQRLLNILGHHFFMNLFRPYIQAGKWGGKLLNVIASPVLRGVGKSVGQTALADFAEFMKLWDDALFDGFGKRARAVKDLLASPKSLFLAVATPQRLPMKEALYLYERLMENHMPFGGFVINRVEIPEQMQKMEAFDAPSKNGLDTQPFFDNFRITQDLRSKIFAAHDRLYKLAKQDAESIASLVHQVGERVKIFKIPFSDGEISNMTDLKQLARHLE